MNTTTFMIITESIIKHNKMIPDLYYCDIINRYLSVEFESNCIIVVKTSSKLISVARR